LGCGLTAVKTRVVANWPLPSPCVPTSGCSHSLNTPTFSSPPSTRYCVWPALRRFPSPTFRCRFRSAEPFELTDCILPVRLVARGQLDLCGVGALPWILPGVGTNTLWRMAGQASPSGEASLRSHCCDDGLGIISIQYLYGSTKLFPCLVGAESWVSPTTSRPLHQQSSNLGACAWHSLLHVVV
jgi:hypothetical protein